MSKSLMFILVALISLASVGQTFAQNGAPAFPGAEGHGRFVSGGRNPSSGTTNVVHVTNLNDSGAGSLRSAVSGSSYKTVVFDVAGVIALKSDLSIGDNTTIAGQTAPEPGVTIRYYTVRPGNNNIIRFIRIRRGEEKDTNDGADAIWQRNVNGLILDHCSFSWSIDEVASFYDNNNFTMQWCTLGESLNNAGHGKGAHGYGGIWGGKLASFHHNLICHVSNRSPRFNGARYNWEGFTANKEYDAYNWENAVQAENVDLRNCVVYNCGNGCYGGPGGGYINMVNNYFKTGPAATTSTITTISVGNSGNSEKYPIYWDLTSRYYISGNQLNNTSNKDWGGISYDSGVYIIDGERYCKDVNHYYGSTVEYKQNSDGDDCVKIKLDSQAPTGEVTTHTATQAFNKVLQYAGASLVRDDVDTRYASEAKNGTATYTGSVTGKKGRIDVVADVNGYDETNFGTGSREDGYDSDRDGIPDEWEMDNGLDPTNATDALAYTIDSEKRLYTNLEVYLNSIVEDIMVNENLDAESNVDEYYPDCSTSVEKTATAIYALKAGDSFTAGQTVNVNYSGETVATITYGVEGGATFTAAKSNSNVGGFTAFTEGNGENGSETGGTVYYIMPKYDGVITIAVVLNNNKNFYIKQDGVSLPGYDAKTVDEKYYGTFDFYVNGGSTYTIFCTSSKLGFYGFNYTWTVPKHLMVSEDADYDTNTSGTFDVSLVRTFKNGMNTLILPFDTDEEELEGVIGATFNLYTLGGLKDGAIIFDEIDDGVLYANTPCLAVADGATGSQETYAFGVKKVEKASDSTLSTTAEGISMVGTYEYIEFPDGEPTVYFIQNGKAYYAQTATWFKPTRTYFKVDEPYCVKSFDIMLDDHTVGLASISNHLSDNGMQLYDLCGRRATRVSKGIYIYNGKKIIVK